MKDGDGEAIPPARFFEPPPAGEHQPREIAERLVAECEEFAHLRLGRPAIMFLFRRAPKLRAGRAVPGEAHLPRFMGPLSSLGLWLLAEACGGDAPDFLVLIDAGWWGAAAPHQRAALVHHELKHCGHARDTEGEPRFTDDGEPVWAIEPHDLEDFHDTVRRFGAWSPDVAPFAEALRDGGAA